MGPDLKALFEKLDKSTFRRKFKLDRRDATTLSTKGLETILVHARDLLMQRLVPAQPLNDGAQTPMRGHPVFVAQHATATCCRGCLSKWHGIAKGRVVTDDELTQLISVIGEWLKRQPAPLAVEAKAKDKPPGKSGTDKQLSFF